MTKGSLGALQIICILFLNFAKAGDRPRLNVLHIIPSDHTNYTVSKEMLEIEDGVRLALSDFKKEFPSCEIETTFDLRSGTEVDLLNSVKKLLPFTQKQVFIGFPRSSTARIVAKTAAGSSSLGISVGASTDELKKFNPNFLTVASPWKEQWTSIFQDLKVNGCGPKNTIIVGDLKDSYSYNFQGAARDAGFLRNYDISDKFIKDSALQILSNTACIFLAMNMSTSSSLLTKFMNTAWIGKIYGTGDWYFYSGELQRILKSRRITSQVEIIVPTGLDTENSDQIKTFLKRAEKILKYLPDPNGVYSYDATKLALGYLCLGVDPRVFKMKDLKKVKVVRRYTGIGVGGNYLSPLRLLRFRSDETSSH